MMSSCHDCGAGVDESELVDAPGLSLEPLRGGRSGSTAW